MNSKNEYTNKNDQKMSDDEKNERIKILAHITARSKRIMMICFVIFMMGLISILSYYYEHGWSAFLSGRDDDGNIVLAHIFVDFYTSFTLVVGYYCIKYLRKFLEGRNILNQFGLDILGVPICQVQDDINDNNDIASTHFEKGISYRDIGKFEEAKEYFENFLEIEKVNLGENHPKVLKAFGEIAFIYHQLGDHQKGKEFFDKSLGGASPYSIKNKSFYTGCAGCLVILGIILGVLWAVYQWLK